MTRRTGSTATVAIVVAAIVVWWFFFRVSEELRIATDPSFVEAEEKLLAGFPDFPAYPGASLEGSAMANRSDQPIAGYRAKWTSDKSVADIMQWYAAELPKSGWTFVPPTDDSPGEQIAHVRRSNLAGYVAAEVEPSGKTEIVVDLKFR